MMVPILEAIETLNSYGMEVVSGIILGLDTDTPDTGRACCSTSSSSRSIPLLTINLLQACRRRRCGTGCKREGRLIEDDDAASPTSTSGCPTNRWSAMWRECMRMAYEPDKLYRPLRASDRAPPTPTACRGPDSPQRRLLAQRQARA